MVYTKWFQGIENINTCIELKRKIFIDELKSDEKNVTDLYDQFAFYVVVYEDENPVGTGRLLFKDGRYFLDSICVLKAFRNRNYGNLIIRMLVRKAVSIGMEKTYASIDDKFESLFKKIGFEIIDSDKCGHSLMEKTGDVGGCCS